MVTPQSVSSQDSVDASTDTYVTVVGADNYYLEYEVKVAAFNALGQGPNSSIVVVMSQEDCKW